MIHATEQADFYKVCGFRWEAGTIQTAHSCYCNVQIADIDDPNSTLNFIGTLDNLNALMEKLGDKDEHNATPMQIRRAKQ